MSEESKINIMPTLADGNGVGATASDSWTFLNFQVFFMGNTTVYCTYAEYSTDRVAQVISDKDL
jgi:hypothetical protein